MTAPLNHPLPLLELDVLRTFVAIAETGSFTAAASAVFRTPSAVSMQIKKLEDMLRCTVFTRDARSVTLTTDGEMLLGYARRLLAINRDAVSKFIVPDVSGVVRLGSPDDYGERVLPKVLKRFAKSHPSVAVDVVIDHVGAATFAGSLKTLVRGGRYVTCGATTGAKVEAHLNLIFFRNLSVLGSTMGSLGDLHRLLGLLEAERLAPVVDDVLPLAEVREAHRRLEAREVFGKLVLVPGDDS